MRLPDFTDVLRARRTLRAHLPSTPTWSYPTLNAACGTHVLVKHENTQPTGAFKVRGGLTLLAAMPEAERAHGLVAYSTGNHAQSIAYAARVFGTRCAIVMPECTNAARQQAVEALGAEVVLRGEKLDDCAQAAERLAAERGSRLVAPGCDPELIAGVATAYLELVESEPDLDVIVAPAGSGTGAAAACLVTRSVAPHVQVIAVQSDASPAAHDSWRTGRCVKRPNRTEIEGLATGKGFAMPQAMLRDGLTDFVLVSDAQIQAAQRLLLSHAHTLAEGAGAAALAAVLADRSRYDGRRVCVVCTGANASVTQLQALLAA